MVTIGDQWWVKRKVLPSSVPVSRKMEVAWRWVHTMCRDYVKDGYEVHIGIESPFVSPKTIQAAIPLCRLNGSMLAAASCAKVNVHEVVISTWKKDIVGKGNASKPEIAAWGKMHWRQVWEYAQGFTQAQGRQDIIDAAGINRHVVHLADKQKRITKFYEQHPEENKNKNRMVKH